jgi:1-deoxy-D-xylulose-5-phosphate reductoisomerase
VDGVAKRLCFRETSRLSFEPPDFDRFPALRLGYEAARAGGGAGAVLNAANEAAVERFRAREIPFGMIADLCADVLTRRPDIEDPTLAQLLECDQWARREAQACIHS